ncbi:flagellar basal body-associated FliL family protein [Marinimicrobium sp. ARAG 43.8]|uniref:flagellar basal body-associated FliL family protein n=1 Tax=Marinimicrobium sp. ARAG 43.8 TaxID=3418719 RepID=UPI003CF0BE4C
MQRFERIKRTASLPRCRRLLMAAVAFISLSLGVAVAPWASAQQEKEDQIYIPLSEPLTVNYGGPGRLKYLRAEISLRVENSNDVGIVRHHMPLIRDKLVMLFSRQDEEGVNTQTGREQLRQAALEQTNQLIAQEEGREQIIRDLLFRNFVVQR